MTKASNAKVTARSLWLGVAAAFLVLIVAWTAIFLAARHAGIAEVPRATQTHRP